MGICESKPKQKVIDTNIIPEHTRLGCGECHLFADMNKDRGKSALCSHWNFRVVDSTLLGVGWNGLYKSVWIPTIRIHCRSCPSQFEAIAQTPDPKIHPLEQWRSEHIYFANYGTCRCGVGWRVSRHCDAEFLEEKFARPRSKCSACRQTGYRRFPIFDPCSNCKQTGGIRSHNKSRGFEIKCHQCEGRGVIISGYVQKRCTKCRPDIIVHPPLPATPTHIDTFTLDDFIAPPPPPPPPQLHVIVNAVELNTTAVTATPPGGAAL